jgi:hypothetical protein
MSISSIPCSANDANRKRDPQVIVPPAAHEGIKRALRGSFGSFPAMPADFASLLDRLA